MNEVYQESHEMMFERVVGQDIDELYCPICGRRILVQWTPDFKKTVLQAGDENAIHTASKSGLSNSGSEYPNMTAIPQENLNDWRLDHWEQLLLQMKFESLWQ